MRSLWLALAISVSRAPAAAEAPGAPVPMRISIEDAMRRAARVSHPVAAARATAERARTDVTAARAAYLPQVTVTGSYVRTLASELAARAQPGAMGAPGAPSAPGAPPAALPFGSPHTWRASVDATQSLWDGGRTAARVGLARSAQEAAELDERGRRAQAVLDVTAAYYGAVLAEELVTIGEASLAIAERTLANAQVGFAQGTTSEFDRIRAEVTRDNQLTTLLRARADRDLALVRLRQLLGLPLDRPLVLTTRLDGRSASAQAEAGPPASAAAQAGAAAEISGGAAEWLPVAEARAQLAAQEAQLDLARAERWPQLGLYTSLGAVSHPHDLVPEDWRRSWQIGVTATWPLFTGFRTTAQIAGAQGSRRAAEALLAEAVEQTGVAERQARSDVDVARAMVAATARSARLARRAYEIAEVRYRQGVSTYLELSDAQLALDQVQIDQVSAARDLEVARVRAVLLPALPLAPRPAPSAARALAVTPQAGAATTGPTSPGGAPLGTLAPSGPPATAGSPAGGPPR